MDIPRLGAESELWPPAYTTATAMWDTSHVFDLHYSSQQHQILNPSSKARDRTRVLVHTELRQERLIHNLNIDGIIK